jgi:hypothetical protein
MPKEIILELTTAIVVLGSVFGASHWRRIRIKARRQLRSMRPPREPAQSVDPAVEIQLVLSAVDESDIDQSKVA